MRIPHLLVVIALAFMLFQSAALVVFYTQFPVVVRSVYLTVGENGTVRERSIPVEVPRIRASAYAALVERGNPDMIEVCEFLPFEMELRYEDDEGLGNPRPCDLVYTSERWPDLIGRLRTQ